MAIKLRGAGGLRRLYEAAGRDKNVRRFHEDLSEALEKKEVLPQDFSIRDLFENFVEDGREIVDSWKPGSVSGGVNLVEAGTMVDTAAFSNITGQIVYTKTLDAFNDPEFIGEQLCTVTPTQFNGEKIPGIGRLGDVAQSIAESNLYPTAGLSEEWVDTPATSKYGFIVPVSKEAIFFDRTGLVLRRAGEVAYWLGLNREKRILDTVLGITTSYKRNGAAAIATYQATTPYINTKTSNALADWTNVEAAELLFDALTDPNTGEVISVMPNTIIVPTALKHTSRRIASATEIRYANGGYPTSGAPQTTVSPNVLNDYRIVTSPLVKARTSSASTWFIGDPKRAFNYMQNWPISVFQAPNNSEAEFTQDVVARFKVTERGAPAVVEPRYMVKSTA